VSSIISFIAAGQMLNLAYYLKVLMYVRKISRRKQPEKLIGGMLLPHNNAPAHTEQSVLVFPQPLF
jgi:hypothetical protein